MATVEPILVSIQADVSQLKAGLAKAEASLKDLDGSVKNASGGLSNMTGSLKKLGAAMGVAFASQQVVQFGKDVILAASNMAESLSKVNVVFGDGSVAVEKFATDAAKSLGMSKQAALEAAGTYGNLFQAFGLGQDESQKMSTSLVQLAGDLASFNNTPVDEALTALRSGLSGETEPLKRFGVALSEARLKQEALAMGLIKSTSDALTPAAKAQASYSLILKDTKLAQGDYARTADGTANKMKTLKAEMDNAKAALGAGLMPVFNTLLTVLKPIIQLLGKMGTFMSENKNAVVAFTIVLGVGTVAWAAYTAVVKAAIIQQKIFNLVSKLNPIGLIITAVALLAAGLVVLWNKSEAFRKILINIGKAGVTAISFIIGVFGDLVTGIMKLVTGPMRLLLKGLSLLGVKQAGTALKEINGIIDTTGEFFDKAAAKVKGLTEKLDQLGKKKAEVEKTKKGAKTVVDTVVDPNAQKAADKAAKEEAKRLEKLKGYAKDVEDIYKDMNDVIADANSDMLDAQKDRDESIAEANKRYSETVAGLNKRYSEALADAQLRYDDAEADARKNYAKALTDIAKDYANKVADIEEKLQDKIIDLRTKATEKIADLNKAAADKQASIVQQSMDRLRNAFASAINLDNVVKGASPKNMIKQLQDTLTGARKLQENAAVLAGMGYSQTFIEQVVKNGPRLGNKIAEALKNSSPEATAQLQTLYGEVETISNTGMDKLAETMNKGGKLATQDLMDAYKQVAVDLKNSLAEVDLELNKGLAEAHSEYRRSMADAQAASTERIAEAKAKMDESLADALVTLTRSRADAKKQLDEGLAEAQKTLAESLAETQKKYGEAIDKINKDTQAKIADLKLKLAEVAALIASLGAQQAAAAAMANAPTFTPYAGGTGSTGSTGTKTGGTTVNNNVSVTGYNLTSPAATGAAVSNQLKYGSTVNTTTLAGILAASAPKTTTASVNTAQGVQNKLAIMSRGAYDR